MLVGTTRHGSSTAIIPSGLSARKNFLTMPRQAFAFGSARKLGIQRISDWLSAMDVLTIGKVVEYAYQKVYGEGRKVDKEGEKIDCKNCLEILCMNQVLDNDLDLRTVKHTIWKSGGDMKLLYREIELRTTTNCSTSNKDDETETYSSTFLRHVVISRYVAAAFVDEIQVWLHCTWIACYSAGNVVYSMLVKRRTRFTSG